MNAIILAAGLGTRLRPLTDDRPKCMVEVGGTPMVERQIQFLHEAGIDDVTLVSGYMAESLEYLRGKYGVRIVPNLRYDMVNNIYSMYVVRELLGDTYVLEGDVYMHQNCIDPDITQSSYFARHIVYRNEWALKVDEENILQRVVVGDGEGYIMSGISFWTKADAALIRRRIENVIDHEDYANLFWDNAVIDMISQLSPIKVNEITGIYEIDTVAELKEVEKQIKIL